MTKEEKKREKIGNMNAPPLRMSNSIRKESKTKQKIEEINKEKPKSFDPNSIPIRF